MSPATTSHHPGTREGQELYPHWWLSPVPTAWFLPLGFEHQKTWMLPCNLSSLKTLADTTVRAIIGTCVPTKAATELWS